MTFSPQLEARFAKLLTGYPPGRQRSAMIPMLMYAQDEVGAVTPEVINEIAKRLGITPLQVDEVIGYYSMLHKKPLGKHHVQVCTNISCLLVGGEELMAHAKRKLGIGHKGIDDPNPTIASLDESSPRSGIGLFGDELRFFVFEGAETGRVGVLRYEP